MNNDEFQELLYQIENQGDLKSQDVPNIDLYMDQIMSLFDVYLSDHKRNEDDKLLTKTMINNYSKVGLLKPIKGKKYSKDHILQMLLIYSLKNTITLPEIKTILEPYHEHTNQIEPIYDEFLTMKKDVSHIITESIVHYINTKQMELNNQNDLTLMLLLLCTSSNQLKSIVESTLDQITEKK